MKEPKVIGYGYKMFEEDRNGNLYPLFIGKNNITPIGKWIKAENIPTKGFAKRPGWHLGVEVPDAPHLKGYDGSESGVYKSRFKGGKRVWCVVEYNAAHNYNKDVSMLQKKCFTDKLPANGYYNFKEFGKDLTWVITDAIKIVKILTDEERDEIFKKQGYDENKVYAKYKTAFEKRLLTTQN